MIKAFRFTLMLLIAGMLSGFVPALICAGQAGTDISGEDSRYPENKPSEPDRTSDFAKGNHQWQTYGSALVGDSGKGEMYALHVGYGFFPYERLSVNIEIFGAYIRSGIDDNGVAGGLDVIFRRHFHTFDNERYTFYGDLGSASILNQDLFFEMASIVYFINIKEIIGKDRKWHFTNGQTWKVI